MDVDVAAFVAVAVAFAFAVSVAFVETLLGINFCHSGRPAPFISHPPIQPASEQCNVNWQARPGQGRAGLG